MSIEYKSLNELVHERLRTEILEGKLAPGTRMKQEQLTKRLGVSRTPIREALQRLETEGLVQFVRRSSAVVSGFSRRRIEEIFEVRALLEVYAAEGAAQNLNEKSLRRLRRLIEEMNHLHSRNQTGKLLEKNDEFHRAICEAAGNEVLLEMLGQVWRDIKRLRFNYLYTQAGHEASTREHETMVDALESHDKELIRKTVRKHTARTMKGILDTLEVSPEEQEEAAATVVASNN